jgi:2-isopropylmalate synthase
MFTLYDTTLRDGTQGEGIGFTGRDKLYVAELLDDFGVSIIEGGWPGSNPKDVRFFQKVRKLNLKHARIAAFGSTCHPKHSPADDENIKALLEAETPVVTVVGKTWLRHVINVIRTDADNNLRIIKESMRYLADAGREVIFDGEHFFDGFFDDSEYSLRTLEAAVAGGATSLVLCDTNGGMLPWQIGQVTQAVRDHFPHEITVGVHVHNDNGCAIANTLEAVHHGATHVQGTVNGFGERCGNADICAIVANLELKLGIKVLPEGHLKKLTELSRLVSETANMPHPRNAPFVGRGAFAHKGGIHVAAIQRDEGSYEHIAPETVGNARRVLVSELSGRGNLRAKIEQFNFTQDEEITARVLEQIKSLENVGFVFESAEASLAMLFRREMPDWQAFFELIDFMVVVEHREGRGLLAEASTKVRIGEKVFHTVAEGVGPVDALDHALRKALREVYPEARKFRLVDYKVRILDASKATSAVTRVLIDTTDGDEIWTTVGASQNIIEASWQALTDSIEYGLLKAGAVASDQIESKP